MDAAIGGTGSQLGAFRLKRDVSRFHPDLVFLDFTVNDFPSQMLGAPTYMTTQRRRLSSLVLPVGWSAARSNRISAWFAR